MNENQRYNKLIKAWMKSGIGEIKDEQLDFFMNELKRFKGWNRRDHVQQEQVRNLLKKFNDRLETLLKERKIV